MKLYSENKYYKLYHGDMNELNSVIENNSIDCVINPYGFIYVTTNNINGKQYIGKKIFDSQWRTYLGSGIGIKNAIKKYGKENFSRKIIDLAESKEELNEKEKFYINAFNAIKSPMFYNIAKGGIGGDTYCGKSAEEMEIIRQKISRKGDKHPMYGKHLTNDAKVRISQKMGRRVICEETGIVYNSTRDVERQTGFHHENIASCCRGKICTSHGFHWKYIK